MDDTVIALLKRVITESGDEVKQFLADGRAEDMSAYNRLVGRYEALKLMERELEDLEKRFIEEQIFLFYALTGGFVDDPRKVSVNLNHCKEYYVYSRS